MRLLVLLCDKPGETFSRAELLQEIWADKLVGEEGLTKAISVLRAALNDPYLIKTIPKQGYAFVGEVSYHAPEPIIKRRSNRLIVGIMAGTFLFLVGLFSLVSFYDFETDQALKLDYQYAYLTDVKGLHLAPAISSDGKFVAYSERTKNEERFRLIVKLISSGEIVFGTSIHPGDYLNPVFSPDNDQLAFVNKEAGYTYISVVDLKSEVIKKIYKTHNQSNPKIDWSPDGGSLVFNDKSSNNEVHDLYSYNLENGHVKLVLRDGLDNVNPVYSPDGNQLAFIQQGANQVMDNIGLYDFKTGKSHTLKNIQKGIYDLDWSNSGQEILFTSTDGFESSIQKINVSSGRISMVSNQSFIGLSVNSNEDQLVASTYYGDNNIWMKSLNESSTIATPILNSNRYEYLAEVSPDQSKIAYVSDLSGSYQVWEYNLVTKKSKQLTQLKGSHRFDKLSWSPDGKSLITGTSSSKRRAILHIDIEGNTLELLNDDFNNHLPQFVSSQCFNFISNRSGRNELWSYDLDQGEIKKVSQIQIEIAYAQVDQKGEYVYYTQVEKEGLWRSTLEGGNPIKVLCKIAIRDFKSWSLFPDGVYFIDRNIKNHSLSFFEFESGMEEMVMPLLPHNHTYNSSMSISKDKKLIVYNQIDHFQSDIVMLQAELSEN